MRIDWKWRDGRVVVALFAATVVLPALVLAVLAFRAIESDQALAERVWQERLQDAARRTYSELERRTVEVRGRAEALARGEPLGRRDGMVELVLAPRFEVQPHEVFAWLPDPELEPVPPELEAAETSELRQGDPRGAAARYEGLLQAAPAQWHGWVALRLARSRKAAGEKELAQRARRVAAAEQDSPGPVPSRLAARFELCSDLAVAGRSLELRQAASGLYRDLRAGTWRLERASYSFYESQLREWAGDQAGQDRERQAMSRLLDRVLAGDAGWLEEDGLGVLAVRASRSRPAAVLVTERAWRQWAAEAAKGTPSELAVEISARKPAEFQWSRAVSLSSLGVPFWIVSRPRDPGDPARAREGRRRMLMAALILVAGVLTFGSLATAWMVRRELRVARLQSDFVAAVSHEFRSPLTGIRQLAEMLLAGRAAGHAAGDAARRRQYYELICQESTRLTRLVENVLDFARIEDGRKQYRFERIFTKSWLEELAAIAGRNRTIETMLPPDVPDIEGDREALSSAVLNLLDNAIKYSPAGTPVSLRAASDGGWVTVEVADHGCGIPPDEQGRIFDRFYRTSNTQNGTAKGVGLGLALVKKTAEAHGAKIRVESSPGAGSRFYLFLRAVV